MMVKQFGAKELMAFMEVLAQEPDMNVVLVRPLPSKLIEGEKIENKEYLGLFKDDEVIYCGSEQSGKDFAERFDMAEGLLREELLEAIKSALERSTQKTFNRFVYEFLPKGTKPKL